jgi:hemerythrin superfamily protein
MAARLSCLGYVATKFAQARKTLNKKQGGEVMANAAQLIRKDHKKVEGLIKRFTQAKNAEARKRIANQVLEELEVHTKLEEEIFYPAVRRELHEEEMLDEAQSEHDQARQLMHELMTMDGADGTFDEKFSELVERIQHHVEEEEGELLPAVEDSLMDLGECGERMTERKQELTEGWREQRSTAEAKRKSKTKSAYG